MYETEAANALLAYNYYYIIKSYTSYRAGVDGPVEWVDGYYLYSVAMRTAGASGNNCDNEVDIRTRMVGVCCAARVLQECKYYNTVIVFMYNIIMYIM